jgi:plasmid maintenance system killer protein
MIRSFQHNGLKKLFEEDDRSKINAQDADKLARILARLNRSAVPQDMAAPGFRLPPAERGVQRLLGRHRKSELARHFSL